MKKRIVFILSLLWALLFINAGLNKFFDYMPMPENIPENMLKIMEAYTTIEWLLPLVGLIEVVGGVLFLFSQTRALGAIVIFPITIGILLTNTINEPSGFPLAIVLFLFNVWILYDNKAKYLPMLK